MEPMSDLLTMRAIPQHPVETTDTTFEALGIETPLLETLETIGFRHPTKIQEAVIPVALEGRDVVGLAMTGSGKTAAFVLPLAQRLSHGEGVRGLVLSPTREIALQTKAFLDLFGRDHELRSACLIGGVAYGPQLEDLRAGPDIVVATPGRLLDHVERRNVRLGGVVELVIDEADHMLDLGFMPQVQRVLELLPRDRRTMLFSATMPEPVERLANRFLHDPVRFDLRPGTRAAHGIDHELYLVDPDDKKQACMALLRKETGSTLVFTRRKIDAEWLAKALHKEGFSVARIHGDLSQSQRVQALDGLRRGKHRILVATDVAARGIDIPVIEHIINFDLPEAVEDYIHRAGRTARGAALGTVSSIATWKDKPFLKELEAALGEVLPRLQIGEVEPYAELRTHRPTGDLRKGKTRFRRKL
jgi:ATP-dependent RNA helicase RhlE